MNNVAFHSPSHPNNRNLLDFARREIGSELKIENHSREFGRPSIVWRLTGADGSGFWLKQHQNSRQFEHELIGLECYVPALGVQSWWCSPTLVVKEYDLEAILMTEVAGDVLAKASASTDEELTMFRLAGRFTGILHTLECPTSNDVGASLEIRDRLRHYLAAGEDFVASNTLALARTMVGQAFSEEGEKAVPCHRDFSPRNWLLHRNMSGIKFGIIDWERCGRDFWLQDVQRMAYDHWHHKPDLREAFFEGYGRALTQVELLKLDVICLASAIASIAWAAKHNDTNFAAVSKQVIARIQAKYSN